MHNHGGRKYPYCTKHEIEFGCDDDIRYEKTVGDARKHLRTRQRYEQGVAFERGHDLLAEGSGRADSSNDARRAEQDETA